MGTSPKDRTWTTVAPCDEGGHGHGRDQRTSSSCGGGDVRNSAFNVAENDEGDVVEHVLVGNEVHKRGQSASRLGTNMVELVHKLATAALDNQLRGETRSADTCHQSVNIREFDALSTISKPRNEMNRIIK